MPSGWRFSPLYIHHALPLIAGIHDRPELGLGLDFSPVLIIFASRFWLQLETTDFRVQDRHQQIVLPADFMLFAPPS
ncbi:MAG: hypothetical protein PVG14_03045 [Anaerolineales bacterium]|jgi:hypothetical protein